MDAERERIRNLEFELEETNVKNELLCKSLSSVHVLKDNFLKIIECLSDEAVAESAPTDEGNLSLGVDIESRRVLEEMVLIRRLGGEAESRVREFKENVEQNRRELKDSVVSLTEENRDVNNLLRVALMEKQTVEKSLNKWKEGNMEQKKAALLQLAERGLQRVGFGFMMGISRYDQSEDSSDVAGAITTAISSTTGSSKSESSEYEEETETVALTAERIMKNLRLEIGQLKRSLEESRVDAERLQRLTGKQAKEIVEKTQHVGALEGRERALVENVEELLEQVKEARLEICRWREACELEVEAGKHEIEERDQLVDLLKQELEKAKAAMDVARSKLVLKEEVAAAAIAAQAAAERSVQLAYTRAAVLRERIEVLTRLLEETDGGDKDLLKITRFCWPWRAFKPRPANHNTSRRLQKRTWMMLPEMQTLLHYSM